MASVLTCAAFIGCTAQLEDAADIEREATDGELAEHDVAGAQQALTFAEAGGLVSIEAEAFTTAIAGTGAAVNARWVRSTSLGSSSGAVLTASPNAGINTVDNLIGPRLDYRVYFASAGTYYPWVRMLGSSAENDSLHLGVDGRAISLGGQGVTDHIGGWHWEQLGGYRRMSFYVGAAGWRTINVWMREDGVAIDKLLLTRNSGYLPSGVGPAQTPAGTGGTGGIGSIGGTGGTGSIGGTGGTGSVGGTGGTGSIGGHASTGGTGGTGGTAGSGGTTGGGTTACVRARRLWFEDFETGDLSRWSGRTYVSSQSLGGCYQSGFSTERVRSGRQSHRVSIGCSSTVNHRIYSGLQFSGDTPLTAYTNTGTGLDAPNGVVVTLWHWLDGPNGFENGNWFSPFTAQNHCNWADPVLTYGLEDPSHRMNPAHVISNGGTVTYPTTRATFPMRQWVRMTVYLNYHTGQMHMWQNGLKQWQANFARPSRQICHFHWGLYASGANTNITLFEDDFSIHKLEQPLANLSTEPWIGQTQPVCP